MQNDGKIQRRLILLTIVNIIVLVVAVALSNFTYAVENLELHQKTLYEITKNTTSEQNPHIPVGNNPMAIALNTAANVANKIYVANEDDGTVSVIDGDKNAKIVPDIKVGSYPRAIALDPLAHKIYVANENDGTVSVIDVNKNAKIVAD